MWAAEQKAKEISDGRTSYAEILRNSYNIIRNMHGSPNCAKGEKNLFLYCMWFGVIKITHCLPQHQIKQIA
jgi:hypothetical protein